MTTNGSVPGGVYEADVQIPTTRPAGSVGVPSNDQTIFVPDDLKSSSITNNKRLAIKTECHGDTDGTDIEIEEEVDTLCPVKLRRMLDEHLGDDFTIDEAATDEVEMRRATYLTYFNEDKTYTHYLRNLEVDSLKTANKWRMMRDSLSGLKQTLAMMNIDPLRYRQNCTKAVAEILLTALQQKKLGAENRFKDHKKNAWKLRAERNADEKKAKSERTRLRRDATIARTAAKMKEMPKPRSAAKATPRTGSRRRGRRS